MTPIARRSFVTLATALALAITPSFAHAMGTCGTGGEAGEHVNVQFNGSQYWVWAPKADPMKPVPLVLVFHGDEGSPEAFQSGVWDGVWMGDPSFIVVAPLTPDSASMTWWQNDSLTFPWADKLLDELASKYNIDVDRVYATGDSGGSDFLAKWGLGRQDVLAAIAFNCGADNPINYKAPAQATCKSAGRFGIGTGDFMLMWSQVCFNDMKSDGNPTLWVDWQCSGHCCGPDSLYGTDTWAWLKPRVHCTTGTTGAGCGKLGDLPGAMATPLPDAGGTGGGGGGSSGSGSSSGSGGGSGGGNNEADSGAGTGENSAEWGSGAQAPGCACHVGGVRSSGGTLSALALGVLAVLTAHRRRRERRASVYWPIRPPPSRRSARRIGP